MKRSMTCVTGCLVWLTACQPTWRRTQVEIESRPIHRAIVDCPEVGTGIGVTQDNAGWPVFYQVRACRGREVQQLVYVSRSRYLARFQGHERFIVLGPALLTTALALLVGDSLHWGTRVGAGAFVAGPSLYAAFAVPRSQHWEVRDNVGAGQRTRWTGPIAPCPEDPTQTFAGHDIQLAVRLTAADVADQFYWEGIVPLGADGRPPDSVRGALQAVASWCGPVEVRWQGGADAPPVDPGAIHAAYWSLGSLAQKVMPPQTPRPTGLDNAWPALSAAAKACCQRHHTPQLGQRCRSVCGATAQRAREVVTTCEAPCLERALESACP
jgi:hypothetical protein